MKNSISKLAAQKVHLIQAVVACTEASSFERTEALNLIYETTDGRVYPLRPAAFTRLLLQVLEAGKRVDSKDFTPVIVNLTQHPANAEEDGVKTSTFRHVGFVGGGAGK